MKKLKKIESVVEKVLEMNVEARSNDDILYLCVCEEFHNGVSSMTCNDFACIRNVIGCPSYESVTRARRKIFKRRPELKPKEITKLREYATEVYIDYAIND